MGRFNAGILGDGAVPVLDFGTLWLGQSSPTTAIGTQAVASHRDELTPIAQYMAAEMNRNAHGVDARHMAELNAYSADACIADYSQLPLWRRVLGLGLTPDQCIDNAVSFRTAAILVWTSLVIQDGPWDHKPKIASRFHPRTPDVQHWHLYDHTLYFYDVWSNIHYGYVGRAAGFSADLLLDGAGLEQIGSNLVRELSMLTDKTKTGDALSGIFTGRFADATPGVQGLRRFDAPCDRAAIEIGVRLFRQHPDRVAEGDLMAAVLGANAITKKAYSP